MNIHILVVTSTFPANSDDAVPTFVRDQIISLKNLNPSIKFTILAPHDFKSNTKSYQQTKYYDEYRYHYFWPFRVERLASSAIGPLLRKSKQYYLVLPFFALSQFFWLLLLT